MSVAGIAGNAFNMNGCIYVERVVTAEFLLPADQPYHLLLNSIALVHLVHVSQGCMVTLCFVVHKGLTSPAGTALPGTDPFIKGHLTMFQHTFGSGKLAVCMLRSVLLNGIIA
jgi:hypothetical protein